MKVDVAGDWDVEGNDFGGHIVRHRHWDGEAMAFVYPDRDGEWAECSMCGATLTLERHAWLGVPHAEAAAGTRAATSSD
jgi:hypothetical protein